MKMDINIKRISGVTLSFFSLNGSVWPHVLNQSFEMGHLHDVIDVDVMMKPQIV